MLIVSIKHGDFSASPPASNSDLMVVWYWVSETSTVWMEETMMLNEGFNHHVDKCCDVHHADESMLEDFEDLGFGGCCECYIDTLCLYTLFLLGFCLLIWFPHGIPRTALICSLVKCTDQLYIPHNTLASNGSGKSTCTLRRSWVLHVDSMYHYYIKVLRWFIY